jgi:ParB-like chromosome segregation protein Spo0J
MSEEVTVVYKPLADLARWPRNPKAHDIPELRKSIVRHGFVLPLVEDETTRQLVAGHGRLEALLQMQADGEPAPRRIRVGKDGGWSVPVVAGVAFESEQEAEAFLLADNRLVEAGGWDSEALNAMLSDLRDNDALTGTGWSEQEVDQLLAAAQTETHRGPTVASREATYDAGVIKQIVLYFKSAEFEPVLARLEKVMDAAKVDNHTAAFLYLLEQHEQAGAN